MLVVAAQLVIGLGAMVVALVLALVVTLWSSWLLVAGVALELNCLQILVKYDKGLCILILFGK